MEARIIRIIGLLALLSMVIVVYLNIDTVVEKQNENENDRVLQGENDPCLKWAASVGCAPIFGACVYGSWYELSHCHHDHCPNCCSECCWMKIKDAAHHADASHHAAAVVNPDCIFPCACSVLACRCAICICEGLLCPETAEAAAFEFQKISDKISELCKKINQKEKIPNICSTIKELLVEIDKNSKVPGLKIGLLLNKWILKNIISQYQKSQHADMDPTTSIPVVHFSDEELSLLTSSDCNPQFGAVAEEGMPAGVKPSEML